MIWQCLLDRPFSANGMYSSGRDGRRHVSPAYSGWKREAKKQVMAQGRRPQFTFAEIAIHVNARFLHSKQDLDNLAKPVLDLLVDMGILPDDSWQIMRKVSVEVWESEHDTPDPHPAPVTIVVMGCPAD